MGQISERACGGHEREMLKIGIVGLGHWGPKYLRLFNERQDVGITQCCDTDTNKLAAVATNYHNIGVTTDYKELLARDVDAVIIATPAATHYQIAKECLLAGKHVLVEKPLALSKEGCQVLINIAQKDQTVLLTGHTYLYNPTIRYIKSHVDNLYFISANRTHLGLVRDDVDCIWDLAPHDVSIANFILDAEPLNGTVVKGYYLSKTRCDVAFITLTYPNNVLCNIVVGWLNATKVRTIEFVGEKERIVFDDLNLLESVKIYKRGLHLVDDKISLRDGNIISPEIKHKEPLKEQVADFLKCIDTGQKPISDGEVGLKVVKALECLKEVV